MTAIFDIQAGIRNIIDGNDSRSCGECTACCSVMGVTELGKDQCQDCTHLLTLGRMGRTKAGSDGGCEVYDERPHSCREFVCLWKHGALVSDEHRPDKLGLIFTITTEANVGTPNQNQDGLCTLVLAHAVWGGAPEEEGTRQVLEQLGADMMLLVCDDYSNKRVLIGPGIKR